MASRPSGVTSPLSKLEGAPDEPHHVAPEIDEDGEQRAEMDHDVGELALVRPSMIWGTRIRWPEEEIGRNSVIPCTTASTMICSIVISPPSARGRLFPARAGSIRGRNPARFILRLDDRLTGRWRHSCIIRSAHFRARSGSRSPSAASRRARPRSGLGNGGRDFWSSIRPARSRCSITDERGPISAPMPSRNIWTRPAKSDGEASGFRLVPRRRAVSAPRREAWSTGSTANSTMR